MQPRTKMESSTLFLMLCLILLIQLTFIAAQLNFSTTNCTNSRGNYTGNSAYSKNLNTFLSTVATGNKIENGYYKITVGETPNQVNGIAVCRVDLSVSDCQNCLGEATKRLPDNCPIQKEAIGYYNGMCMVRYSDRPIFGIKEITPNSMHYSVFSIPASDEEAFRHKLAIFFDGLRKNASGGDSYYKFAFGFEDVTSSLPLYGLMQCNPDLTNSDCSDCLQVGIRELESCCTASIGAGIYAPSCSVEFENYPFINTSYSQPISHSASPSNHTHSKPGKGWISVIVVLFVVLIPLATLGMWLSRRRKKTLNKKVENDNIQITCVDSLQFDFSTIQDATDNFSNAKRLGKGIPTKVYKGKLPNNEQEIAVKRHEVNAGRHGEVEIFNNEVWLLADLQHRNLVKLLGFCIVKDSRLLVYEYQTNESLDWFLYDSVKRANLNWETRYKIILGIARGLLYLHEDSQLTVIHRDLKPSNILLDSSMNPKISNFSKASLIHADQPRGGGDSTVLGTYGYMPPEYVELGNYSVKSDVFSFGVLLLEIISGKLICNFSDGEKGESLPSYTWRKWIEGKAVEVVDQLLPRLQREMSQILICIKIALLCVQENPTSRPTMSNVALMLSSSLVPPIAEPLRPALIIFRDMDVSSISQKDKSYDTSENEDSISYLDPR